MERTVSGYDGHDYNPLCLNRGPRIGEDVTYCKEPKGHTDSKHRVSPDDGFGDVSWPNYTFAVERPSYEVRLTGLDAPITERQSVWLKNALNERDADWQDHMRQSARLHTDSLELAKTIARSNALEEAATLIQSMVDGPFSRDLMNDAAQAVRALKTRGI